MSRRLTYEEKGKGLVTADQEQKTVRVRVPQFDNSELLKKHELTLIGRVTNLQQQRVWSLIHFLSDLWKTGTKAVGADLGQDRFQFQFEAEEDLQEVLANRPYHFARWMVILQRWEPTTAPDFPALIPFWIRVQGIPIHLWSTETLQCMGRNVGNLTDIDISPTAARMRVIVDGLKPLIKSMVVEFANGDEVKVDLVYEKLEKHCYKCFRLDHEERDCPLIKKEAEVKARDERYQQRKSQERPNEVFTFRSTSSSNYQREAYPAKERLASDSQSRERSKAAEYHSQSREYQYQRPQRYESKEYTPRQGNYQEARRSISSRLDYHLQSKPNRGTFNSQQLPVWREKIMAIDMTKPALRDEASEAFRAMPPPGKILAPTTSPPKSLPRVAMEEALGELRDVMIQYSSHPDPTESAARKVRMMQAEVSGEMEDAAAKMVIAAMNTQGQPNGPEEARVDENLLEENPETQERSPRAFRLGPSGSRSANTRSGQKRLPVKRTLSKRNIQISPKLRSVAISRRRRIPQDQASPIRKFRLDAVQHPAKTRKAADGASTSRPSIPLNEENLAEQQPPIKLIPRARKKKADFQDPPNPLP